MDGERHTSAVEQAIDGDCEQAMALLSSAPVSPTDLLNRRLLQADGVGRGSGGLPPTRIAIVSLLFNWPSTGGGIVHTAELAQFLSAAGYDVCHFYAVYTPWEMGKVTSSLPYPSVALQFDEAGWNRESIIDAYRNAVREFQPDAVIVTDSWNTKPMLATAVSEFPYYLRLAALECLCPLNNVRLIPGEAGRPIQCHKTQLATRDDCVSCVANNQHAAGPLHAAERQLAMFNDPAHGDELKAAFANAEGVLAVNPLIGTLCEPYTNHVHVIPSGFDAARFEGLADIDWEQRPFKLLFAGLVEEYMKGFHVLFEACSQLYQRRQDFELHVTAEPTNYEAPFLRYRGWQDQASLPALIAECHALTVPTIAQEALGRTAVEAMGAGRPVIASRIGGLPFTVTEGLTGLLANPGDATDLADQIERLIDDSSLAQRLGESGRQKFVTQHTWDSVINCQYRPMFRTLGIGA